MLISLGLALLGQSTMVTAQQSGSGIRVFPNTGSLSNFPGTSWRYNGELLPWGPNPNLDFIPTVKDESAVMNVQNVIDSWMNTPEINQVFSLETPWQSGMSAAKGAELQKKISSEIKGRGMGMFQLGFPTVEVKHGTIDPTGYEWLEEMRDLCQSDCLTDFLVVNYEGDHAADMAAELERLGKEFQVPIWVKSLICITRDGGYCTEEVATLLMNDAIGWFKSSGDAIVERWAWDGADPSIASLGDPTGMLNADGTLNAMGKKYDELR